MTEIIGVCGLGYIGLPLVAAFADVGFKVIGCDKDAAKVEKLQNTYLSDIFEAGLNDTLQSHKSSIEFTTDYEYLMSKCTVVIVTVGTPLDQNGEPNFVFVDSSIDLIGKYLKKGQTIILKSTVSPGMTEEYVAPKLEKASGLKAGEDFFLAFCPERTIEGIALYEIHTLPKIVGGINKESTDKAADILKKLGGKVIKVSSPKVAEMCKIVDNVFRATNIALANELGFICEKAGINTFEVIESVNENYNRSLVFKPGLGANGPCLTKDPDILLHFIKEHGVSTPLVEASVESNRYADNRVAEMVLEFMKKHKKDKYKISLVGLAFKGSPQTTDTREAPALKIYNMLKNESNVEFSTFDPLVKNFFGLPVASSLEECVKDSDVIIFLTNHPRIMGLDIKFLSSEASKPLFIVDAWRNLLDVKSFFDENIHIFTIGVGWNNHWDKNE